MDNSIEKQVLTNIYNDLQKQLKERSMPKLHYSDPFTELKKLSIDSKKKCLFEWVELYSNQKIESYDFGFSLLDIFCYLLHNIDFLSENELRLLIKELITSKMLYSGWSMHTFAWTNSLFLHLENHILTSGTNDFVTDFLTALRARKYQYDPTPLHKNYGIIEGLQDGSINKISNHLYQDILFQKIDSLMINDDVGIVFCNLFSHAKSELSKSIPSKKWMIESQKIINNLDKEKFVEHTIQLFNILTELIEFEHSRTKRYFDFNSYLDSTSEQFIRSLVWITPFIDSTKLNNAIYELGLICLKKKPMVGGLSNKIGNACIYTFSNLSQLEGMAYLVKYKSIIKLPTTLKNVEKYILELAKKSGKSKYDLEDLASDTYELNENHQYVQEFGNCLGKIIIQQNGSVKIEWLNNKQELQKSVPATIKNDYSDDYKAFMKKVKDIHTGFRNQIHRIESFYLQDRKWEYKDWKNTFLFHPHLGVLTTNLIWYFESDVKKNTGFFDGNRWIDSDQKEIEWISDKTIVRLWHPINAKAEKTLQWREYVIDNQITQPFKQAFREVYILTDAEVNTRDYSNRFASHILRNHQFGALCKVRSWLGYNPFHYDGGMPTLLVKHYNISVEYWISQVHNNESYDIDFVTTDQVRFYERNMQIPLSDVPAIVFSETMRDVDLFVGVSSIGNDPNWRDGGTNMGNYWQNYSFGELGELAKTRKEALERLIPRLKIAKVTEIRDKFVVVKGKIRTYKIHIGSGNILMEPNDQYLCIVADRSSKSVGTENIFLPFEGDAVLSIILSKAFLLADDDKITDSTIISQIKN